MQFIYPLTVRLLEGLLILLTCSTAGAQKVSNIDFDHVKAVTTDSTSDYFYTYLLEKVANFDGYISKKEFHYLYYGNAFYGGYDPYGTSVYHDVFKDFMAKQAYTEAISYG